MNKRNEDIDNVSKKNISWCVFLNIFLARYPSKSKLLEMKYKATDNNTWRQTRIEQIKKSNYFFFPLSKFFFVNWKRNAMKSTVKT